MTDHTLRTDIVNTYCDREVPWQLLQLDAQSGLEWLFDSLREIDFWSEPYEDGIQSNDGNLDWLPRCLDESNRGWIRLEALRDGQYHAVIRVLHQQSERFFDLASRMIQFAGLS